MSTITPVQDRTAAQTLSLLRSILKDYRPRDFNVRLWDGSELAAETATPRFTLVLNHEGALRRMFRHTDTDLSLGEAYIYGDFDIEGDLLAVFPVGAYLVRQNWDLLRKLHVGWQVLRLPKTRAVRQNGRGGAQVSGATHSPERDRQAVRYHYDVSNDFYALWLDSRMVYSCAYFASPDDSLQDAQERKLDYVCRKLRLQRGERLLDIGCGWGGLVIHAAQNYGVTAYGITLSRPQAELANQRIQSAGLAGQCRVEVADYRELDQESSLVLQLYLQVE